MIKEQKKKMILMIKETMEICREGKYSINGRVVDIGDQKMLMLAAYNRHRNLILGAWGVGHLGIMLGMLGIYLRGYY